MKFLDEVRIVVKGGDGGDGCLSFRREKYLERGGPDGGNGGRGGNVYIKGCSEINTFNFFYNNHFFCAESGGKGFSFNKSGRKGKDLFIKVPFGTQIFDGNTMEFITDIVEEENFLIANGGACGVGNCIFKNSINRSPKNFTKGKLGTVRFIKLELKLLSDVGLLGEPNCGKSTFINIISGSTFKVGNYDFTTIHPNIAIVKIGFYRSFTVADVPGIIDGASKGNGMGIHFLKHLSRTKLLLHILDSSVGFIKLRNSINIIENELNVFDSNLHKIDKWFVLNKIDLLNTLEKENLLNLIYKFNKPFFMISSLTGEGIINLCLNISKNFNNM